MCRFEKIIRDRRGFWEAHWYSRKGSERRRRPRDILRGVCPLKALELLRNHNTTYFPPTPRDAHIPEHVFLANLLFISKISIKDVFCKPLRHPKLRVFPVPETHKVIRKSRWRRQRESAEKKKENIELVLAKEKWEKFVFVAVEPGTFSRMINVLLCLRTIEIIMIMSWTIPRMDVCGEYRCLLRQLWLIIGASVISLECNPVNKCIALATAAVLSPEGYAQHPGSRQIF